MYIQTKEPGAVSLWAFCILLFCCGGNSCHADLRVGQQDTDERVPEHMRVKSLNPGTVSD